MRVNRPEGSKQIVVSTPDNNGRSKETIEIDEEKTADSSSNESFREEASCDEEQAPTTTPNNPIGHQNNKSNASCIKRLFHTAVFIAIFTGTMYAIFAGFGDPADLPFWPDDDPFDGQEYTWSPQLVNDRGLTLTVLNALENKWDAFFDLSLKEWDNGDPDVVRLNSRRVGVDSSCTPSQGVLKFCNNDYGDTGWEGLNESLLSEGHIVSSVSKMNDYYLDDSSNDNKEYTMCHELGHGLGLPHTDEAYYNRDKRNCMDYTIRPGNNKKPGRVNFERLATMYGTEGSSGGGRRALRKRHMKESDASSSEEEQSRISGALERLQEASSGVLIEDGEVQTFDLGDGFTGVVHMLRAEN